jgi:hypothetical protein
MAHIAAEANSGGVRIYPQPAGTLRPATGFAIGGFDNLPRVDISYSYGKVDKIVVKSLAASGVAAVSRRGRHRGSRRDGAAA